MLERLRTYWSFTRPFTLLAPALGMLSGGVTAAGAVPRSPVTPEMIASIALGTVMAAVLNGASNALNQIYDLENDRINKPRAHDPVGPDDLDPGGGAGCRAALYVAGPPPRRARERGSAFVLAATAAVLTYDLLGMPPLRTKRTALGANLTIAIPRGVLLKVGGMVDGEDDPSPPRRGTWAFDLRGVFLLGATTTKDFADIEGDRAAGCLTLPVRYGVRASAWMTAPFFVLPFLCIPLGVELGLLSGNAVALSLLGYALAAWGLYVAYLILRKPEALATTENHISWTHMYVMMIVTQIGFAAAYFV